MARFKSIEEFQEFWRYNILSVVMIGLLNVQNEKM
jgi:hypothetical protein